MKKTKGMLVIGNDSKTLDTVSKNIEKVLGHVHKTGFDGSVACKALDTLVHLGEVKNVTVTNCTFTG